MEGRIIPIPLKLIINQVAQTIPGDEGPIEMQKNRKIGAEKQTATPIFKFLFLKVLHFSCHGLSLPGTVWPPGQPG